MGRRRSVQRSAVHSVAIGGTGERRRTNGAPFSAAEEFFLEKGILEKNRLDLFSSQPDCLLTPCSR